MGQKLTRRNLLKVTAVAGAASILPAAAQDPAASNDNRVPLVEKQLAEPLSEDVKELLERSLDNLRSMSDERKKHKLPENSEPCFVYRATEAR